ncbi:DUF4259 domain-containing protein [Microbulbifer okhotskensis]|uniref:DUF4259 domain-containing protein n=1 Tax=Microbulbifer okhotskensis TaxID=2926617 RepID=UPI00359C54F9
MGARAEDAFGNDSGCDWAAGFAESPCLERAEEAIDIAISSEEYLESDEACDALIACEIVARLKGNWGKKDAYSESIDKWIASSNISPSKELISKAEIAIIRILGENSELRNLWDEDGENIKWPLEMDNPLSRVTS